ncbi:Oxygen-dependent choline dehydrogenase [Lachnellula cervina]|uniref:Oxygen-dependent choline dehydrogenase n=1 Tax=Lachnellula cervina TaxID=1316786 RepID=A0A7D8YYL1_9HELO|nr:Oxygen-dependent choline dehydrogenase [Lachnellula cervina]
MLLPQIAWFYTIFLSILCITSASSHNVLHQRATRTTNSTEYEYIVIGSGAGGGVVAARLALAGHSVLLIEAGDDQGANFNYTIPAFQAKSTEDSVMAWDFWVRHYEDDARQELDYKLTYTTPDGAEYTGLDPPAGSTIKGVLYPRSATLGGCTAHNALVAVYPDQDDFQYVANLTGDASWSPDNMREYFVKMEKNEYLSPLLNPGHGFDGWLSIDLTPATLALEDSKLLSMIEGAIEALGGLTSTIINLASFLAGDANSNSTTRDSTQALYQIPLSTMDGSRNGVREFLVSVANAANADGSQKYPLDIRTNCLATKVDFDTSGPTPTATGVSFLDGTSLYRADKRAGQASAGTPGSATASREVIVAGGAYNSPQLLKLSGIGPAEELESFNISVLNDLPGVGTNLQDHYEVSVQGQTTSNFSVLDGCTFDWSQPDECLEKWEAGTAAATRGTYVNDGFVAAMFIKSSDTPDGNYDEFGFGGPVNFRGYFPGYSVNATDEHNWWTWALLKSHPRNRAGTVKLASADPRDTPNITFNYFDTGSGDYAADLETITESIEIARYAFGNQSVPFTEILPGSSVQSKEDIEDYIKNTAWGHHCSCTCPIGADDDPMAVLDSSFRVRGVSGLRVVDASVYPKIPGTFTMLSTYLVGEKAADVILTQLNATSKS